MLTIFTQYNGKIDLLAKGARKINSRRGGHLDLFNFVEFHFTQKYELDLITEVTTIEAFADGKVSRHQSQYYFYLAELIVKLVPNNEQERAIFDRYHAVMNLINKTRDIKGIDREVNKFVIFLLKSLGYWSDSLQGVEFPDNVWEQRKYLDRLVGEVIEGQIKTWQVLQ